MKITVMARLYIALFLMVLILFLESASLWYMVTYPYTSPQTPVQRTVDLLFHLSPMVLASLGFYCIDILRRSSDG